MGSSSDPFQWFRTVARTPQFGAIETHVVYDVLADRRRRRILAFLADRTRPVAVDALAAHLAERESLVSADETSGDTPVEVTLSLHHVHLPKLVEAGFVERDEAADAVALADHRALEHPLVTAAIRGLGGSPEEVDRLFTLLANDRSRTVLSVLEGRERPVTLAELAEDVARREAGTEPSEGLLDRVTIDLYHAQLPKLDDHELVAYDAEAGTVRFSGPFLRGGWEAL